MRRPRSERRLLGAFAVALALGYAVWLRPRLRNWGATADEAAADYPGDEVIPRPNGGAIMATNLPASPEAVWQWLAQMGGDRGGWYSRDWLDNNGKPSADRIHPEWQHLELSQRLSRTSVPGQQPGSFTVTVLQPNRTLVLRSIYGLFTGLDFDPSSDRPPPAWVDGIWGFHLRPTPDGGTRLVARTRSRTEPSVVNRVFGPLLGEPMHFAMQTRQFRNLKRRITTEP